MDLDDEDIRRPARHHRTEPLSGAALAGEKEAPPAYGLRQRHFSNRDASEETLMDADVEMVHLDQVSALLTAVRPPLSLSRFGLTSVHPVTIVHKPTPTFPSHVSRPSPAFHSDTNPLLHSDHI